MKKIRIILVPLFFFLLITKQGFLCFEINKSNGGKISSDDDLRWHIDQALRQKKIDIIIDFHKTGRLVGWPKDAHLLIRAMLESMDIQPKDCGYLWAYHTKYATTILHCIPQKNQTLQQFARGVIDHDNNADCDTRLIRTHNAVNSDAAKRLEMEINRLRDLDASLRHAISSNTLTKTILEEYLQNGADINAKDSIYYTPLHYAAFVNNQEIAEILLNAGADKTILSKLQTTAIDEARSRNFISFANFLESYSQKKS